VPARARRGDGDCAVVRLRCPAGRRACQTLNPKQMACGRSARQQRAEADEEPQADAADVDPLDPSGLASAVLLRDVHWALLQLASDRVEKLDPAKVRRVAPEGGEAGRRVFLRPMLRGGPC
jgi:hypothetical protein